MTARRDGAIEELREAARAQGLRFIVCADGRFALVDRGRIVLSRRTPQRLARDLAARVVQP